MFDGAAFSAEGSGMRRGGSPWAALHTGRPSPPPVETCKLNGGEPQRYFAELLTRLVDGWPQSRIDELMPWRWTAATGI